MRWFIFGQRSSHCLPLSAHYLRPTDPHAPERSQHNATSPPLPDTASRSKHNRYTRRCRPGRGKKVWHYFLLLFYCTDVCYRLGSVNSSTRVPKTGKPSWSWPTTCHPLFHQFKHLRARIYETESPCSWLTTAHLSSLPLLTTPNLLKLAKLNFLCTCQQPLTSVLQIRALACSNWQN